MFKPKNKQPAKLKHSKERFHKIIDSYYEKVKETQFEIYLNSGVNKYYQKLDQNLYSNKVIVQGLDKFLEDLVKGFSSIYQIDYKSFQWKDKIQGLTKAGKELIRICDKLKQERMQFDNKKKTVQDLQCELQSIVQQYNKLKVRHQQLLKVAHQYKLKNYDYQKQILIFKQINPNPILQNTAKSDDEKINLQSHSLIKQNESLKLKILILTNQCQELKTLLIKIKNCSFQQEVVNKTNQILKQEQINHFQLQSTDQFNKQVGSFFQRKIIANKKISSVITSYLPPKSLVAWFSLSKLSRFFLLHNCAVIHSAFSSIVGQKRYELNMFDRHMKHFEMILQKIPEQIIQFTFYQFSILKQNIGGDFAVILNLCGNIFQGKFNQNSIMNMNKSIKQYVQSKQILHHIDQLQQEQIYLKINHQLVQQFFQQRKFKKINIMKEIEKMNQKIILTQSLYSVDNQTLNQFHQIALKHFSILFVLAKHLFSDSRNLQYLNAFLLNELNSINKSKFGSQYDLEDLKAQIDVANKTNNFLSQKCIKSEERILRQTAQHLQTQRKLGKLAQTIKNQQENINELQKQLIAKDSQNQLLKNKYDEIKNRYNHAKEKYNRLANELFTIKQSIQKIN